jgi:hypothetical protein
MLDLGRLPATGEYVVPGPAEVGDPKYLSLLRSHADRVSTKPSWLLSS